MIQLRDKGQVDRDYLTDVALGIIIGTKPLIISGYSVNINIGTPVDVWGSSGFYPWMTEETELVIVSTSAEDSEPDVGPGTGAKKVLITGLNRSYEEVSQEVVIAGTNPTALSMPLFRINSAIILSAGTLGINVGDLIIKDAVGDTIRGVISAGSGHLNQSQYTIPLGFTLVFYRVLYSASKPANISIYVGDPEKGLYQSYFEIAVDINPFQLDIIPISLAEKTDFGFRCPSVTSDGTNLTAAFYALLKNNLSF